MSHAVLRDRSTLLLANKGLHNLRPALGLKETRDIPNGFELLPVWSHEEEPHVPVDSGSRFLGRVIPVPTLESHPVKECNDCGVPKRAPVMHVLPCKHDVCHKCLTNRALWPEKGMPRDALLSMLHKAGQRLYDPNSRDYARDMADKESVLGTLWQRLGWACCKKTIPFGDLIREGVDSWIITSLIREWDHALRAIEGEGNSIILRLFDGFFRLRVEDGVEVAYSTHPRLKMEIKNPFRRPPSNRNGDKEGLLHLSVLSDQLVREQEIASARAEWDEILEQFPLAHVSRDGSERYDDGPFSTWKLKPGEPEPGGPEPGGPEPAGLDEPTGASFFSGIDGEWRGTPDASFLGYDELWAILDAAFLGYDVLWVIPNALFLGYDELWAIPGISFFPGFYGELPDAPDASFWRYEEFWVTPDASSPNLTLEAVHGSLTATGTSTGSPVRGVNGVGEGSSPLENFNAALANHNIRLGRPTGSGSLS
ncbi:uncharacterized protein DNG_02937 [Cephalotrichum gorgonifer]|uniref:Uncharacterized protein n=1 Tax=Cephalotrichum gorgonifer TaxID=2041049 RepID=A0AAE8MW17_9PEZI|nr:uncharacterized protein DNG_02937 [Cephalotrichum gorgonifer]